MTTQARQYTALADAELLAAKPDYYPFSQGLTHQLTHRLPPLRAGVSPAIISRAILTQQAIPFRLFSTGLPDRLKAEHTPLPDGTDNRLMHPVIAKAIHHKQAMSLAQVTALLESGLRWGHQLAMQCKSSYLIVGECVVGGTTTAQAVLTALGYDVAGRMSSSHQHSNHCQKQAIVRQGLRRWQQQDSHYRLSGKNEPLQVIAQLGDPMQIVAAGMTIAASQQVGVLLAGGAQMLAVYKIAQALCTPPTTPAYADSKLTWNPEQVVVGTTRWVIEDATADTSAIARDIGATYIASEINFSQSRYFQLRAYERGFVKEGMGAGGCAIAAHLYKGWNGSQLRHAVESELKYAL